MNTGLLRRVNPFLLALLFFFLAHGLLQAQRPVYQIIYNTDDYKFRFSGYYWNANPSGDIEKLRSNEGILPFNSQLGFTNYHTLYGEFDWKFRPRQHLKFKISPNSTSNTVTLQQSFQFQNYIFDAGTVVTTKLTSFSFSPGYQYDFFRSERGHLGVLGEVNFLNVKGEIDGPATLTDGHGGVIGMVNAKDSREEFAPLPAIGLEGKVFATTRIYGEGYAMGGYYFGYGTYYSFKGDAGVVLFHNFDIKAGYLLGERIAIHGVTNNTHVNLRQNGPIFGAQYSF